MTHPMAITYIMIVYKFGDVFFFEVSGWSYIVHTFSIIKSTIVHINNWRAVRCAAGIIILLYFMYFSSPKCETNHRHS